MLLADLLILHEYKLCCIKWQNLIICQLRQTNSEETTTRLNTFFGVL